MLCTESLVTGVIGFSDTTGIFAFGDAQFHGSTGNIRLNQPVTGMAVTPDGGGVLDGCQRWWDLRLR
jgi:hypothetical protein